MSPIHRITIIGCSLLFIILLLMGVWYLGRIEKQPTLQPSPSPTPFSQTNQVIPPGTISLPVTDALTAFNFPQPLPFFDERNVVQSLRVAIDIFPSPTAQPQEKGVAGGQTMMNQAQPQNAFSPFLSYRIFKQSKVDCFVKTIKIGFSDGKCEGLIFNDC